MQGQSRISLILGLCLTSSLTAQGVTDRKTLLAADQSIWCIAFSPDSKTLAVGTNDRVEFWDPMAGKKVASLEHRLAVQALAFSSNGKLFASAGFDEYIKIWELPARKNVTNLKGHEDEVFSVAFSPDGTTLASASMDRTAKLWDLTNGKEKATLKGHESWVKSIAFSPDGKALASGSWDKTVRLWDPKTGEHKSTWKIDYAIDCIAFSPDSSTLAVAGSWKSTPALSIWDVKTGKLIASFENADVGNSLAFSTDGKMLATGGARGYAALLWDVEKRKQIATLKGHDNQVQAVAFSRDGKMLASGGNGIKLWDVVTKDLKKSDK